MQTLLELNQVSVGYGRHQVVKSIDLQLQAGEIGCLLGPSGCGKSTLLRAIAGFEPLMQGRIMILGKELATAKSMLPPEKRDVGMVFQDIALFPHLSVAGNVAFFDAWVGPMYLYLALAGMRRPKGW